MAISEHVDYPPLSCLERFKDARVLVVGDVIHDVFIWGKVSRISPEAPVPVVEVTRETSLLGGAANVVNNIMALGARALLAGVVGADAPGEAVLKTLAGAGADVSCMQKSEHRPTPVKTRVIAHQQQVVRFDKEQKRELRPATFEKLWGSIGAALGEVDAVIVSDYAKGTVSAELMKRLVSACDKSGLIVAVDPKPAHAEWYAGVTTLTPNNKEASEMAGLEIAGDKDLLTAGARIVERLRCDSLLVTRGDKGMTLFQDGAEPVHVPVQAREVFDVTGAGDTVIGTLVTAMASGLRMEDAVRVANLAAGIVVGKLGTSVVTAEELARTMESRIEEQAKE